MKNYSKEDIINYYLTKPMTLKDVAKKFNLCVPTISKVLKENNINIYTKTKLFSPQLDEDYFKIIDTENKAYFLGLIISDGCIFIQKSKQNSINICLQKCDKYLLEYFIKDIHTNKHITTDNRGCFEISILSTKMVEDLLKYGVTPRKSLNTIFPTNLNNDMYPHLLRGIIDGDGSIAFYKRKNRPNSYTKAIRLCQGNKKFLNDIVQFLHKEINTSIVSIYQEKESLWSIAYRSNDDILKIYNYLYKDATIYMKRKKDKYTLIIQDIIKNNTSR